MTPYKLYNKLEFTFELSAKKNLFINLKLYYDTIGEDPYLAMPVTFLVMGNS